MLCVQDPNEDTEWNDILRKKGILPPKEVPKDDEEEELALQQQSVGRRSSVEDEHLFLYGFFIHVSYVKHIVFFANMNIRIMYII